MRLSFLTLGLAAVALAPDFSSLLAKPTDEIKRPKPLPEGTYSGIIQKFEFREVDTPKDTANPKKAVLSLTIGLTEALDDVDQADLGEALQGEPLSSKNVRPYDMWLTADAQYRIVELCQSCGIATEGSTLGAIIPELQGKSVNVGMVKVQSRKAGEEETFYSNIGTVAGTGA